MFSSFHELFLMSNLEIGWFLWDLIKRMSCPNMLALRNRRSVFNDSFCDLDRDDTVYHVSELMIRWLLYQGMK